ncbi:restriction endonuclease [Aestuariibius insulae]|uniref:restriction endonuclease n=1 Tax=Aestuariibius insulae TaxID=2058287 RepID=UPI00345ECDAF
MPNAFNLKRDGFPDLPAMMLATINALKKIGGSAHLSELDDEVIEAADLTEEEQSYMMKDGQQPRVNYYLAWSRTYLKRGKAIDNSRRAVWALTELGERLTSKAECEAIFRQVQAEEAEKAKLKSLEARQAEAAQTSASRDDLETETEASTSNPWTAELLATVGKMDPGAFERLSQRLLREAGFTKVEVRGKTGDGGIDGVGVLSVNLVSFQVYFQCKRWKGSVGSREIRDFRGALQGRADKGLFITTGTFTAQASEEATRDGAIAIDLINGARLCDLLKQFDLGVSTEMIEHVTIDKAFFKDI